MTDVPSAKPRDVIRVLLGYGFVERKAKGSHRFFRHPESRRTTVVPVHSRELSPHFVREIAEQAGIEIEDFVNRL